MLHSLRELGDQVDSWVRTRLWAQVLVGLVLGVFVGYLLGPDLSWVSSETAESAGSWLALPGNVFLGLITMVLVPLVIGSIVQGLNGSASNEELRSIGLRFLVYVVLTTTVAAALGITLARYFEPGAQVRIDAAPTEVPPPDPPAAPSTDEEPKSIADALVNMLPDNPYVAFAERDMLAIVVLAVIFGLACRRASDSEEVELVLKLVNGLLTVAMRVVKWAMYLTPFAVFGLMAQLVAQVGLATLVGLTAYVGTVIIGLLGLLVLYLAIVTLFGKRNPFQFLKDIGNPMLVAFSTSSSAAVMPLSIETAATKLRVPESVANIIIPMGATINMAGTALYQSVAIIFMAQVAGIELSTGDQAMVVVTLVASSIGAPGTPGVGVVILASVASDFGIPAIALPLVLGIDRILDMCRTAVNLAGDLVATVVLSPSHARAVKSDAMAA